MPLSQGWLRVTHRKLDPKRSTEWLPYHSHDEYQPLARGEVYEIDVEIWPASVWLPKGSKLSLVVAGRDFERPGADGPHKGSGPFIHTDAVDRPADKFDGDHTLHTGGGRESYLLLPVVG
jgi:predicted acyl esterase